jgi:uncharacterized protein (TIGR02246 family)
MEPSDVAGELTDRFADTWNRHDMEEFALMFHDDASFVNVVGMHMRGRDEIQRAHAGIHAGPYRNSHLVVELQDARALAPNVVLAHFSTQLSGDERAPGVIRSSYITMLIEGGKSDGWKVAAAQNTLLPIPEDSGA